MLTSALVTITGPTRNCGNLCFFIPDTKKVLNMDIYCPCQAAVHSSQSWTTNLSSLISAPGFLAIFLSPFYFLSVVHVRIAELFYYFFYYLFYHFVK